MKNDEDEGPFLGCLRFVIVAVFWTVVFFVVPPIRDWLGPDIVAKTALLWMPVFLIAGFMSFFIWTGG